MEDRKEEDNKLYEKNNEEEEEVDEERLISTTPKMSFNSNESLSQNKGKIIIIITCFLLIVVGSAIALVFIFKADSSGSKEDKKDEKIIVKDNIIELKYEIKSLNKKIPLINNQFLNNISSMLIQNSDKTMNISIISMESFQFFIEDNFLTDENVISEENEKDIKKLYSYLDNLFMNKN